MFAHQDILIRYRRSILGPFWISISMAAMMFGLTLLYAEIFHVPFREYLSYIGSGLLAWTFIVSLVVEGSTSIVEGEGSLKNVPLPLSVLVFRILARNIIVFGHNFLVVVIILIWFDQTLNLFTLLLLPAVLQVSIFGYLFGLIAGPISARFRDVPQVLSAIMSVAFFLTPIMWNVDQLSTRASLAWYNPFYHMVDIIRAPLLGSPPSPESWLVVGCINIILLIASAVSLGYFQRRIALWL